MKSIAEVLNNSYRKYMVTCDYCLNGKGISFLDFNEVYIFIENLKKQGWILSDVINSNKDFCCEKCKKKYEKYCAKTDLSSFNIHK